jgi:hypothetical protein
MSLPIGHLLRAGTNDFVAGCSVSQLEAPCFGALVRADPGPGYGVYGLIYDIAIDDDGLVRQLVTAGNISPEVMQDNRERRIVPVELSVLTVGYVAADKIFHRLPPRPPLSLDVLNLCPVEELARFTDAGAYGYFRHILRAQDVPTGELLAAHIQQAAAAHPDPAWSERALGELITLLRDDYPTLMSVLAALADAGAEAPARG